MYLYYLWGNICIWFICEVILGQFVAIIENQSPSVSHFCLSFFRRSTLQGSNQSEKLANLPTRQPVSYNWLFNTYIRQRQISEYIYSYKNETNMIQTIICNEKGTTIFQYFNVCHTLEPKKWCPLVKCVKRVIFVTQIEN